MYKERIEFNKRRSITIGRDYIYSEAIKADGSDDYTEFLTLVKGSDYSIYYMNGTFEEKVGTFTIESESVFFSPFKNLIGNDECLKIECDLSERYVELSKTENGDIVISIHLLPGEVDGTIELKNIMSDIRSQASMCGTNLKHRLSQFFDELVTLAPLIEEETKDQKCLERKA